ncbi:putative porin [Collimonas sp. PA-H2]|uniref:porin n=1 Tax=Collimonas sp. PA-H2 TaxID=1881062 RepID=UPI000BF38D30|nr:porin [Collimonas sp. PA-H2]PFH11750.1 putative porin [Collimonas sp. PA-H2]
MNPLCKLGAAIVLLGMTGSILAQTSVAVSGVIDTGISYARNAGNGAQGKLGEADSILGVSNVGFRGKEDLGGGLNAVFNLQAGFNPGNGAQSAGGQLFSRNALVGLESGSGALTFGKQWNFNDDWLVGSVFKGGYNSGAIFKFSEFDAVSEIYNNTVKYVSPSLAGFQGGAMLGLGEAAGSVRSGQVYNLAACYQQGPLLLAAAYDHEQSAGVATGDSVYKLATLGASYGLGVLTARLGYAHSDISGPGVFQSIPSLTARKAYAVEAGLDYALTPAFTCSADVIYRRNTTLANSSKVARLLAIYSLSKRTSLIANLAHLSNAGGASETLVGTDSTAAGGGFANQSQTALALGIRHLF